MMMTMRQSVVCGYVARRLYDGDHYTMTFNNDGTGVETDDTGSDNFKYSYTGDRLIISYNGGGGVAYSVSITGKTLMLTIENSTTFYTLTRL